MKNLFFVSTILLVFVSTSIFAQEDTRNNFKLGVKAGFNYANVYDSQGDDFVADGRFGLAVGAMMAIPLGATFGFQPEVLYSQKGYQGSGTFLGSSYEYTRTTHHVDIPLQLQIKPSSMISIVAGPQFSFLFQSNNEFTGGSLSADQQQDFDNDNLRKNLLGIVGGVDINLNPATFGVRAGWDVSQNNGDGTSNDPRYKNQWLQMTFGLWF